MKSTKRKTVVKPPTKNLLKSAPGVVFILGVLLILFLIDIYWVVSAKNEKHDHKHRVNEQIDKKS
jgi:hypothetical protein